MDFKPLLTFNLDPKERVSDPFRKDIVKLKSHPRFFIRVLDKVH